MRKTQLIELDLRSGILSNESLYAIGNRLRSATNSVWGYPYPRNTTLNYGAWLLRQPLTFPYRAPIAFTGVNTFRDIGFTRSTLPQFGDPHVALIGTNATDHYAVWGDLGGAELPFAGGVVRPLIAATRQLGCSVRWQHPGNDPNTGAATTDGVLVFSHPALQGGSGQVYYLLDSAASIRSLTADVAPTCPAGAAALAVHLDRLWLLTGKATGESQVWFTDPFNLDSIRTTNVVQVNGQGTCLVPGQFGTIDASGVPRLVIGCANGVYVLDGDPQLGGGLQADLRMLTNGVGMNSSHVAATTPYGVFFLGTDGDLWHIPLGCQTANPVGLPIRNRLAQNNLTGFPDMDLNGTGSVVWFHPYLYLFPGGETGFALLAEPTAQGIARFWGPVTLDATNMGAREAVVRAAQDDFALHAPSGTQVTSLHSVDTVPSAGTARYLAFDPRTEQTGTYPNGANTNRTAAIASGLINQPGHRVTPTRVLVEMMAQPVGIGGLPVDWTVTFVDEVGTSYPASFGAPRYPEEASPPIGTGTQARVYVQHYVAPPMPATRAFGVVLTATTGANLALHRVLVEYAITPAQF